MQSNTFQVNNTIDKIVEFAPVVLFTMLFLVLFLTGYLQQHFYTNVFSKVLDQTEYLAFLFPLVVQILRLVTGFLSASFFKKRKFIAGTCVFIFSIWLTMFEHNEAKLMGEYWVKMAVDLSAVLQADIVVNLTKEVITSMMHILIWGALFLEFFLAIWLSIDNTGEKKKEVTFSANGATQKSPKKSTL